MNYRGSYRKLFGNAKAAMIAAIEIYNKPTIKYRDESFIILLLNSWELLLKALLSKNKASVFYPKKRHEPYRTLSWYDALSRAEKYFPPSINPIPVRRNLELLGTYRDNAVHFYNADGFGVLLYALAQTSITNFRDIMDKSFDERLEEEITWHLIPLGIKPPIDPIAYMSGAISSKTSIGAVRQFISELARAVKDVEDASQDSGRLLTIFKVKYESTKKIDTADLVVGVKKAEDAGGPLTVYRTQDPNITHPLRQMHVVQNIGTLHGKNFTVFTFQSIAWKHNLKNNPLYCWRAEEGLLTKYSHDVVAFIKRLSAADIDVALIDYRASLRARKKKKAVNS